ncbi:hypothetical protein IAT38_004346 [Cryptococcus sp. DSM 104549]
MASEVGGDASSQTPLDLLINAIAGNHYAIEEPQEGGPAEQDVNLDQFLEHRRPGDTPGPSNKRPRQESRSPSPRQRKVAKTLASHVAMSSAAASSGRREDLARAQSSTLTTVEVWHPTACQKSYGKERRIMNPPPILRFTGPLLDSVASVTLTSLGYQDPNNPVVTSGTQSHRIVSSAQPLLPLLPHRPKAKRAERLEERRRLREAALRAGYGASLPEARVVFEGKERSLLQEGLTFPGLWVGDEAGKSKEFRLELKVSQEVVVDEPLEPEPAQEEDRDPSYQAFPPGHAHETGTAFAEMLAPSMDELQPLAEAVQQAKADEAKEVETLADHFRESEAQAQAQVQAQAPAVETGAHLGEAVGQGAGQEGAVDLGAFPVDFDPNDPNQGIVERPLATFLSGPLRIVSKPSIKTAKARSMASCLSHNSPFALWTRLNAQTVRTKYMKLEPSFGGEGPALTYKTGKWTPFSFELVERAEPQRVPKSTRSRYTEPEDRDDQKLTYGSVVRLVDLQSGIKSDAVRLVKVGVSEARVGEDEGQPVSELQRVGLVKMLDGQDDLTGGSRWYLSAPGARLGGAELAQENPTLSRSLARSRPNGVPPTKPEKRIRGKAQAEKAFVNPSTTPKTPIGVPSLRTYPQPDNLGDVEAGPSGASHIEGSATLHEATQQRTAPPEETEGQNIDPAPRDEQDAPSDGPGSSAQGTGPARKRKKRTKRLALAAAVLAEDEDGAVQTLLEWTRAERSTEMVTEVIRDEEDEEQRVQREVVVEQIADWMSWTIGGVACFSSTFFNTLDADVPIAPAPLDPIPRVLAIPTFHHELNTLDLTLSQFYFPSPNDPDQPPIPLDIYLGPLGPLRYSTWRSTAPPNRSEFANRPVPAVPYDDSDPSQKHHQQAVMSSFSADEKHVIVVVRMPGPEEIVKAMQSCVAQAALSRIMVASKATPGDDAATAAAAAASKQPSEAAEGSAFVANAPASEEPWLAHQLSHYTDGPRSGDQEMTEAERDRQAEMEMAAATLEMEQGDLAVLSRHLEGLDSSHHGETGSGGEGKAGEQGDLVNAEPADSTAAAIAAVFSPPALNDIPVEHEHDPLQAPEVYDPPRLSLYTPQPLETQSRMVPLPLLLVRKSDGVGFATGRSVVAQKLEGSEPGVNGAAGTRWGLRLVES